MNTKKRVLCIMLSVFVLVSAPLTCLAEQTHIYDTAGVLTETQVYKLGKTIGNYSETCRLDIVVYFTGSLDGKSAEEYAANWYDGNGRGYDGTHDGIILLVCPSTRDYWITTSGSAVYTLGSRELDVIEDAALSYLGNDDWEGAARAFCGAIDGVINPVSSPSTDTESNGSSKPSTPVYDEEEQNIYVTCGLVAVGIGIVISLIILLVMKSRMNNVKPNIYAGNYLVKGSFDLTQATEQFLRRDVTRVKRPEPQSSGSSGGRSSGGGGHSHGGRGGRF